MILLSTNCGIEMLFVYSFIYSANQQGSLFFESLKKYTYVVGVNSFKAFLIVDSFTIKISGIPQYYSYQRSQLVFSLNCNFKS